ncbi:MAG TPA: hypothetical protein VFD41_12175 [Actinomycetales bacterium]|nr:hypothetical protein [Actinomycetales bacterium]
MASVSDIQRRLPQQLGAWAAASVVAGAALEVVGRRRGDATITGFARQCLLWGAVAGGIAAYGAATRHRPLGRSRLETILWANALADVGYLAGGLLWARRGGDAARGAGAAVVVQGAYLLASDVSHALTVRGSS